jgi:hypothetical protein
MTGNAAEALYHVGKHKFFLVSSPIVKVIFSKLDSSKIYDVLEFREKDVLLVRTLKNNSPVSNCSVAYRCSGDAKRAASTKKPLANSQPSALLQAKPTIPHANSVHLTEMGLPAS